MDPVWITYAWTDNDEGNFDYLVQVLQDAGIPALYDKIALIPGRRLWPQIAQKIGKEPLSGWAYLVTPQSIGSLACQEELAYALQRALESQGEEFPLVGLVHQVSVRDVPLPLRIRLCVNLSNPDWVEEIRAALAGRPPRVAPLRRSAVVVKIHRPYLDKPDHLAIELRPRFGELRYWRIGFPTTGPRPIAWGFGPANGGGISAIRSLSHKPIGAGVEMR